MIQRLTNRQIINTVEKYFFYKSKLNAHQDALKWELMTSGETEKASELQTMIDDDKKQIGQFLDLEVWWNYKTFINAKNTPKTRT